MTASVTLTGLFIYPVKSTRGIPLAQVHLSATGFAWDRQWMMVDDKGLFISQRTHPQLARIVPELTPQSLLLRAPDLDPLEVPLDTQGEERAVRVFNDRCAGIDQGPQAAAWLGRAVGQLLRLVRVPPQSRRMANPEYAGPVPTPVSFADGYPILVCNQASLDDLNARMPAPVPMERFRPNIVIDGLVPWAEDHIDTLSLEHGVTLRLVKPCTRCTIPSIDQHTGLKSTDPAPVLRQFRFDRKLRGVLFGENAVIEARGAGLIERGSRVGVS
ncbi:MAG: MOSC N-terminal beta barrel domain-containing protein [Proteobacteria bacterium]|nr:MOSC N-terminal beta barrel domain-containing protein [Pseudomonadota bacterium]